MNNSFGFLPDDQGSLDLARQYLGKIDKLRKRIAHARVPAEGKQGTLLHLLSEEYCDSPFPYEHLGTSLECCADNLSFLWVLIHRSQNEPNSFVPIWAVGSMSRSVLISACRILFVLLPETLEEQKRNLSKIHYSDMRSAKKYKIAADSFDHLTHLHPQREFGEIPKNSSVTDTNLTEEAVAYVARKLEDPDEKTTETMDEYVKWMWHSWSGLAHGLYWPVKLPSRNNAVFSGMMPGYYAKDFLMLTALAYMAIEHCRDAFLKQL